MMFFTYKNFAEQIYMQATLCIIRFVVIGIMIGTLIADIATHSENEGSDYNPIDTPPLFRPQYIGIIFPIIFLAISFHNPIPNIAQLIKHKEANLHKIMVSAVVVCTVIFLAVGTLAALVIDDVDKLVSLEWKEYSAGSDRSSKPSWAYIVIYCIVLFPAIDVISIFPIYAIALSDNMIALKYEHDYENKISRVMQI